VRNFSTVLVTGGAGFIGCNFIRYVFNRESFAGRVVNLDALTYAGNLESLQDIETNFGGRRYFFERADIRDRQAVCSIFDRYEPEIVVHFAAESHVDRSILGPREFIETNILGTFNLLEAARAAWKNREGKLFHHVSTDEVYGSIEAGGRFTESSPYNPHSPYSASKAASDHLAMACGHTYGLPVTLSNCSNNYGPYQFPEKLIPLMITNMIDGKPLPVYGDGRNVRDWLYVQDHAAAIWNILESGTLLEKYNIGGENEWENIKLVREICKKVAAHTGKPVGHYEKLITYVKDRPAHDRRYALDCSKIKRELDWGPSVSLPAGLDLTVDWYLRNSSWSARVKSGAYREWIKANYGKRAGAGADYSRI
jgi:dTDP-glucose 4,6-dehydratase